MSIRTVTSARFRRFLPAFVLIPVLACASDPFSGHVSKWIDGDTFWVGETKVRLCGIDTPELDEPGYAAANAYLKRLIGQHVVTCRTVGGGTPCDGRSKRRSYWRIVAQCFVGGVDVANEMVRSGHARDWPKFWGGYYARKSS